MSRGSRGMLGSLLDEIFTAVPSSVTAALAGKSAEYEAQQAYQAALAQADVDGRQRRVDAVKPVPKPLEGLKQTVLDAARDHVQHARDQKYDLALASLRTFTSQSDEFVRDSAAQAEAR